MPIPQIVQSLRPGDKVNLYEIDLTVIGFANTIKRFTASDWKGGDIWFGGKEYIASTAVITGFKKNSDGQAVQPNLVIPNVDKGGGALLQDYKGLIGAKVTKLITFAQFLDYLPGPDGVYNQANPNKDPNAHFLPEIWYVDQKLEHSASYIKFALASLTDFQGKSLPARRIWKDLCERTYRSWDSDAQDWDYTDVQCPYTGATMWDQSGLVVQDPRRDSCGKDYKNCALRFGVTDLPGWFFPGVVKV